MADFDNDEVEVPAAAAPATVLPAEATAARYAAAAAAVAEPAALSRIVLRGPVFLFFFQMTFGYPIK